MQCLKNIWEVTVLHVSPIMFIFSHLSLSSLTGNSTFESVWAWQYCSILWHRNGTFLFWFSFLYVHFNIFMLFTVVESMLSCLVFFFYVQFDIFFLVYYYWIYLEVAITDLEVAYHFLQCLQYKWNVCSEESRHDVMIGHEI